MLNIRFVLFADADDADDADDAADADDADDAAAFLPSCLTNAFGNTMLEHIIPGCLNAPNPSLDSSILSYTFCCNPFILQSTNTNSLILSSGSITSPLISFLGSIGGIKISFTLGSDTGLGYNLSGNL